MRRILSGLVLLGVLLVTVVVQSAAPPAADDVIALTKAMWASANRGDVAASMKNVADDYTEFNPDYPTRLDGKKVSALLSEASNGSSAKTVVSEMSNAKVQVYGDVAILTYNYVGVTKDKDGKTTSDKAKSTRVYVKKDGTWMLVHANFGAAN